MTNRLLRIVKNLLKRHNEKAPYWKYRIKRHLLKMFLPGSKTRDDFDWRIYTDHYVKELELVSKSYSISISKGDYIFDGKALGKRTKIPDLHPNYRIIYETILQLSPASVLEVGCGRGDHLHNLSVLDDKIELKGIDISRRQIDYLGRTYPELKTKVKVLDISRVGMQLSLSIVDAVFTQAVLMHIQDTDRYETALCNIFGAARSYVVLMENWTRHDFLKDIQSLHSQHRIPWDRMFFHYRISPEFNRPHLMVISRMRLEYPVLSNYSVLTDNADNTAKYE